MSKTFRNKNGIVPRWLLTGDDKKPYSQRAKLNYRFYGDSFNHDGDKNPPKSFRRIQKKKFRRKVTVALSKGEEVIPKNFKMPYYHQQSPLRGAFYIEIQS